MKQGTENSAAQLHDIVLAQLCTLPLSVVWHCAQRDTPPPRAMVSKAGSLLRNAVSFAWVLLVVFPPQSLLLRLALAAVLGAATVVCNLMRLDASTDKAPWTFVSLPASHFVDKLRWTLSRLGFPYIEQGHVALFNVLLRGRTVPSLVSPDGRIVLGDTSDALQYLAASQGRFSALSCQSRQFCAPNSKPRAPLAPSVTLVTIRPLAGAMEDKSRAAFLRPALFPHSKEWELIRRFDTELGPHSRRWAYWQVRWACVWRCDVHVWPL